MRATVFASTLSATSVLVACNTMPPRLLRRRPRCPWFLNQLKDELNAFIATKSSVVPNRGVCYDGKKPMDLIPVAATATLKAVAQRENEAGVGLAAPLGVLSIDPSFAGAYSNARTQTLTIPLSVPDISNPQPAAPGEHALAAALASFRDEILKVDHAKTPCLAFVGGGKANFKVSIAFDVSRKTTTGVGLQLAIFKVSDKEIATNEAHQ